MGEETGNGRQREAGQISADIQNLKDDVARMERKLDKVLEEWKPDVESRLSRLGERMTLWHGAQAGFTAVVGMIAALFGK